MLTLEKLRRGIPDVRVLKAAAKDPSMILSNLPE